MSVDYLDLLFTASHEWLCPSGLLGRVGITDYAQARDGGLRLR